MQDFNECSHRGVSQQFGKSCCRVGIDCIVFFMDGLFCMMGHFRLGSLVLVEEIIKTLCVQTPIIVQNVRVLRGDHRSLRMTGIALHGFDIAAVQLEFVCNTGVSGSLPNFV